jgi:hypothetical protein
MAVRDRRIQAGSSVRRMGGIMSPRGAVGYTWAELTPRVDLRALAAHGDGVLG